MPVRHPFSATLGAAFAVALSAAAATAAPVVYDFAQNPALILPVRSFEADPGSPLLLARPGLVDGSTVRMTSPFSPTDVLVSGARGLGVCPTSPRPPADCNSNPGPGPLGLGSAGLDSSRPEAIVLDVRPLAPAFPGAALEIAADAGELGRGESLLIYAAPRLFTLTLTDSQALGRLVASIVRPGPSATIRVAADEVLVLVSGSPFVCLDGSPCANGDVWLRSLTVLPAAGTPVPAPGASWLFAVAALIMWGANAAPRGSAARPTNGRAAPVPAGARSGPLPHTRRGDIA